MTVADILVKIGKARETADYLDGLRIGYNMKNGDWRIMRDAITCLEDYISELENKIVN